MNDLNCEPIQRTGALVKVLRDSVCEYKYGLTIWLKDELVILFKDGTFERNLTLSDPQVEYVCATSLLYEKTDSLEKLLEQFETSKTKRK